jgi:ribosome-associated protein
VDAVLPTEPPVPPASGLEVLAGVRVPENELDERFVRSSGPGGQNVNKVASAVELRFDVAQSPSLPPWLRDSVLAMSDRRINKDGVLVISAMRFRTQDRNRQDARERLVALLQKAAEKPKPRIATRPSRASKERRLQAKQQRGAIKKLRQQRPGDDG